MSSVGFVSHCLNSFSYKIDWMFDVTSPKVKVEIVIRSEVCIAFFIFTPILYI